MQAAKQEAMETIGELPDDAGMDEIRKRGHQEAVLRLTGLDE